MLLHIPAVLNGAQLGTMRQALAQAEWHDGAVTAGAQAAQAKHNLQLAAQDPLTRQLGASVASALQAHPIFLSATLPRTLLPPMFNCHTLGAQYGQHIDAALQFDPLSMQRVRTDVSVTVFLSEPEEYEGGELVIDDTYGAHEVKLPAGDAIIYPASSLHRVAPVTHGTRLACFSWVQSMVADSWQRKMLFELDMTIQKLRQQHGDSAEIVALSGHYHNLLRLWAVL